MKNVEVCNGNFILLYEDSSKFFSFWSQLYDLMIKLRGGPSEKEPTRNPQRARKSTKESKKVRKRVKDHTRYPSVHPWDKTLQFLIKILIFLYTIYNFSSNFTNFFLLSHQIFSIFHHNFNFRRNFNKILIKLYQLRHDPGK